MGRYSLAEHIFVCVNDEHVVLLDLKQDRYWALEASRTAPLGDLVPGWPVQPLGAPVAGSSDPGEAEEVAEVLLGQGILSGSGTSGKNATPVRATPPARELLSADEYRSAPMSAATMVKFIAAAATAKLALRLGPFEQVVHRFSERKRNAAGAPGPLNIERLRRLVESFFRLRVFFFSSRNECLFDSLALLNFLARYGIYPDWVFGVQARPFAAHCWVQLDDIVVNDTIEHVSGYTPIMVV